MNVEPLASELHHFLPQRAVLEVVLDDALGTAGRQSARVAGCQAYVRCEALELLRVEKVREARCDEELATVRVPDDAIVLDFLQARQLDRGDVYETRDDRCRLGKPLAGELSRVAPRLYAAPQPHCFAAVQTLMQTTKGSVPSKARRVGATRA